MALANLARDRMHHLLEAVLAIIAFLLVCVFLYHAWYQGHGWETSGWSTGNGVAGFAGSPGSPGSPGGPHGEVPSWTPAGGRSVANLRFRNAVFTMVDVKGQKHTKDVTATLNGMAAAYGGKHYDGADPPSKLRLTGPINPFSFTIKGVNDLPAYPMSPEGKPLVKQEKINKEWAQKQGSLPASLQVEWRTLGGKF